MKKGWNYDISPKGTHEFQYQSSNSDNVPWSQDHILGAWHVVYLYIQLEHSQSRNTFYDFFARIWPFWPIPCKKWPYEFINSLKWLQHSLNDCHKKDYKFSHMGASFNLWWKSGFIYVISQGLSVLRSILEGSQDSHESYGQCLGFGCNKRNHGLLNE